jgi:phosphoglycerol transferase MdoB-like AlkP superfamily enzyme
MTDTKNVTVQVGPGLPALLGVTFIVLKLTHVIDWSWLWVLSPFWFGFAVILGLLAIGGVGVGIAAVISHVLDRKNRKAREARRKELQTRRVASRAIRNYGDTINKK